METHLGGNQHTETTEKGETVHTREVHYTELYAHFTRNKEDAEAIIREHKLRTSHWQGRRDRIFAVNLTKTVRDDRVQLGGRQWGVLFTTPAGYFEGEEGTEGEHPEEVYWYPSDEDEKGEYITLDFAILIGPDQEITADDVRSILQEESPDWDRNED